MALVRIEESFRTQLEWQEIEERLYAMAEWQGYQLVYEDPEYVLMRGNSRKLIPTLQDMPTTLTVRLERANTLETVVSMRVLLEPDSAVVVSQGEVGLLREELGDLVAWVERLESPEIDRSSQYLWGHRRDMRRSIVAEAIFWTASIYAGWHYGLVVGIGVLLSCYVLSWSLYRRLRRTYPQFPLERDGPHMGLTSRLRERYHQARSSEIRDLQTQAVFEDPEF